MLVLSRKQSQQILVGRDIRITVVKVERNQVRIGIEAPRGISILREELASEYLVPEHDQRPDSNAPTPVQRVQPPRGRIDEESRATVSF